MSLIQELLRASREAGHVEEPRVNGQVAFAGPNRPFDEEVIQRRFFLQKIVPGEQSGKWVHLVDENGQMVRGQPLKVLKGNRERKVPGPTAFPAEHFVPVSPGWTAMIDYLTKNKRHAHFMARYTPKKRELENELT